MCKYCTEYEDLPEYVIDGKPVGKVFDTCIQTDENGWWHIELPSSFPDIGIRYCPYCGRDLTPDVMISQTRGYQQEHCDECECKIVKCTHCKYCKQDDYYKHELYCSKLSDDEHTYWVPVGFYCGYGEELEDD